MVLSLWEPFPGTHWTHPGLDRVTGRIRLAFLLLRLACMYEKQNFLNRTGGFSSGFFFIPIVHLILRGKGNQIGTTISNV